MDKLYLQNSYYSLSDEQIVESAQKGDKAACEYLLCKYQNLVYNKVTNCFVYGAEKEDLIQEALIGLYEAIMDYKHTKSSFKTFAQLCITRQLISAIRIATRQYQLPLNMSLPLEEVTHIEVDLNLNPEEIILMEERIRMIKQKLKERLTPLEWEVLNNYLNQKSYREIAASIKIEEKAVDNALTRIKRKIANLPRKVFFD